MNKSAEILLQIRKIYRDNPQEGYKLLNEFTNLQSDPTSEYYAPHASGKSNYTDMTDFFGVDRFDDDFFRQGSSLMPYLRYGAAGTPLAPIKKSSAQEIAAYQFYRVQKADEPTRQLEGQWRALQKELADKVSFGMDDNAIVQSIDWSKYGALKDYEQNVKIRNVPMLTRPVSFSEGSVYGVLAAVRKGDKVGQTDRDYLPELTDYYDRTSQVQKNSENQAGNPASFAGKTEEELDTVYAQQERERQNKIDFTNLQYKMFTGQDLTEEEKKRWTELYPTQGHGKPGASIPAGPRLSSSGGGSGSSLTVEQKNNDWMEKYTGFARELYGDSPDGNQSVLKQLSDLKYAADTIGMTVDQYLSDVVGSRPDWLGELDYKERLKNNPESITRLRPIEEVLTDYRAGNELSEAEREMIWMYDKKHPGLMGGMKFGRPVGTTTPIPIDTRRDLGATAYAALSAADSEEMSAEESNSLILSIGQDMDAAFGRYSTLEDYYSANLERKAELQAFADEEKVRSEDAAAADEAQRAEEKKAVTQAALVTLTDYANGAQLDSNQQEFIKYMKSEPITDADIGDATYRQLYADVENIIKTTDFGVGSSYSQSAAEAYGSANNPFAAMATTHNTTQMAYKSEAQRIAKDILDTDTRLAKAAGLTLTEYYEMFPEMQRDPQDIIAAAQKAVCEKWNWEADNRKSFFEYIFGVDQFEGEDVGVGSVLGKGAESGARQFAQGFVGFWRNYFTETENKNEVIAQNRMKYSGYMGRAKAGKDFDAAIAAINDPKRQEYWKNNRSTVKDVLDLPFDFSDEAALNTLYENKKAIDLMHSYMVTNGTKEEYAAFVVAESLVDNGLSMGTALAATAITGNPTVGTFFAFGPRAMYDSSEIGRAAGLPQLARNGIGLGAGIITTLTDQVALTGLHNYAASLRGSLNLMKSAAMNEGAGFFKKLGAKVVFGTATIGTKFAENVAEQGSQEFVESVFTDAWLNLTGAQNKGSEAVFEDGVKEGVMAAILTPFLSGQTYLMTPKGNVRITPGLQQAAQKFLDERMAYSLQRPGTVAKIIEANAAADTIETLTNGALADVDTTAIEKTKEDLIKAEADLAKAANIHNDALTRYTGEMHKCTESFTPMSDEKHDMYLQTLANEKNAYQSAKKIFNSLSEKLKLDQGRLNRLLSGIIARARTEAKVNAQAAILSEAAAQRMDANMQKADEMSNAIVRVEQPSPENVSNDGDHLAQPDEAV